MANSLSSEPGGDVPLCAGAPLDELLRSLHQLRRSIKDESQIFPKDLPQAVIQLKPASDKQMILEVVSCLESNGSDIISRINEEAFCALLHVLLMGDAPSENQSVLHLLLRHVRNLSSEARRSTRNVTTAAARSKIRLMMETACTMLLGILFDETNVERRVWVRAAIQ
ncbi:hypothetical protein AAP_01935 [Ascosphaera apis ARSEF 7405]|uniref:Uncharacterized protein n=1 Tax=Ascosphaera apis ARSEF 7405 TaxID=392613 RepID=A0A168B0Z4_9EURO|nr:hypothetical protein AAP_01935 [Ascosphaera apis ARSEF 7405]